MATTHLRFLCVLLATALLGACGQRLDIEVKASIDGQPAAQAKVSVDGEDAGVTDAQGVFAQRLRKKAGRGCGALVGCSPESYKIRR
jgi:tRNA pseudouridine-54 N-methylase